MYDVFMLITRLFIFSMIPILFFKTSLLLRILFFKTGLRLDHKPVMSKLSEKQSVTSKTTIFKVLLQ